MTDLSDDQKRRDAITAWWERKIWRDFIARKRAALKARHTQAGDDSNG